MSYQSYSINLSYSQKQNLAKAYKDKEAVINVKISKFWYDK